MCGRYVCGGLWKSLLTTSTVSVRKEATSSGETGWGVNEVFDDCGEKVKNSCLGKRRRVN